MSHEQHPYQRNFQHRILSVSTLGILRFLVIPPLLPLLFRFLEVSIFNLQMLKYPCMLTSLNRGSVPWNI